MWPTPGVVDHLVKKSSGIFIYAATVIGFVGDQYRHPQEELESVLSLDPKSTAPLDDLYTQILLTLNKPTRNDEKNVATDRQLRILHTLWQMSLGPLDVNPEEVDTLLDLPLGTCRLNLRRLHSLLVVPPRPSRVGFRERVEFLHASFPDYLGDSQRSQGWCVSTEWLHSDYLFSMIRLLSSPPVTDSARAFHGEVVRAVPRVLSKATPCDELFAVLRNEVFQHSLFLAGEQLDSERVPWPHRGSLYPVDLIELWEHHRFLSVFTKHLEQSRTESTPTFKFDPVYREILASHPALVYILTACLLMPGDLFSILRIHGWTYSVFKPFLSLRPQLELPFPAGDSPLDFVADPDRISELGLDRGLAGNVLVLQWIRRAKEVLTNGDFWLHPNALELIAHCEPSSQLITELATLDLSKLCEKMTNREDHESLHMEVTSDHHLRGVVQWLQDLPEPPLEIIEFWERQIADIQRCISEL
ncbi:hypothetical protein B0H16DRAFT_917172 [Mycena metata]|uniref:Uncharacterized protein n=1 Tax=Mycena metata TaxID=1033252 RepID=A0AAD7N5R6_9AGAR|nr:hypothetical protein B0H16DRAFT_917172 [Mycena metata]